MASTYLTRTPGSAGNRKTWTYSAWIKRGKISDTTSMFSAWSADSIGSHCVIQFDSNDLLDISTWSVNVLTTTAKYRDPSAWYHIVMAVDTTQTTASDRVKFYVNGEQVTSFSTSNYPAEDFEFAVNNSVIQTIGSNNYSSNTSFWNGSMANVEMVDGQQLTPAYFGSTDSNTGIWTPQATSTISSYGTNGFKLKMDTATPGADTSGNTNNFTVGGGTPTLTQGSPSNNWCTFNPLVNNAGEMMLLSNGNTSCQSNAAQGNSWKLAVSTFGMMSGKWYWEAKLVNINNNNYHGVMGSNVLVANASNPMNATGFTGWNNGDGGEMLKDGNNTSNDYGTLADNDILGVALNADDYTISIYKNGSALVSNYALSTTGRDILYPCSVAYNTNNTGIPQSSYNFGEGFFGTTAAGTNADGNGQGLFAYAVPSGYYALNTKNLEAYG